MISKIEQWTQQANDIAKAKGYWTLCCDPTRKGELVMMIVGELGECLEAHRRNPMPPLIQPHNPGIGITFEQWYDTSVKCSMGEELADVVIRILNYTKGQGIQLFDREFRKQSMHNFGHDLLRINLYIVQAFYGGAPGHDWGYVLQAIATFADRWDIDLPQHIEWKLCYNATRANLHGKAY